MKNLVILTGMSGSGKSVALESLEDMGYFCIDNLPLLLLPKVVELMESTNEDMNDVAIGIDLRGKHLFEKHAAEVNELINLKDIRTRIVFLDTKDNKLISRYKETRRSHPLNEGVMLSKAIEKERHLLVDLKGISTRIIDTTDLSEKELKDKMYTYLNFDRSEKFTVNVISFGFKHDTPKDSDLMFDVRFLPNPYYIEALRPMTGQSKAVYDYVMKFKDTEKFYKKLMDMLRFMLPLYVKEGKSQLNIAIGCTGGQHRSVALTERVSNDLNITSSYEINAIHRDANREGHSDG